MAFLSISLIRAKVPTTLITMFIGVNRHSKKTTNSIVGCKGGILPGERNKIKNREKTTVRIALPKIVIMDRFHFSFRLIGETHGSLRENLTITM